VFWLAPFPPHSLSTWANETTKDITVSQTMLRHAKPDTTAIYTHGNFGKALETAGAIGFRFFFQCGLKSTAYFINSQVLLRSLESAFWRTFSEGSPGRASHAR